MYDNNVKNLEKKKYFNLISKFKAQEEKIVSFTFEKFWALLKKSLPLSKRESNMIAFLAF